MVVYNSARGRKAIEDIERRGAKSNTIGTLTIDAARLAANVAASGQWAPRQAYDQHGSIGPALVQAMAANPGAPLLWVMKDKGGDLTFIFGFDLEITQPAGPPLKVGHVGLAKRGTISGEISQNGAAWSIDNNSGAWGSMGANNGKTLALADAAAKISYYDPGRMVVNAKIAYSRHGLRRMIQQSFLYESLFR